MRQKGFTLIELMVVVMVIAILAAIAIPNYREYSQRGRRADAVASIGDYQLRLERWRAENPSFADCGSAGCGSGNYPTIASSSYYKIELTGVGTNAYTLTATPQNAQAGDRCGNLVATASTKPTWATADCNK